MSNENMQFQFIRSFLPVGQGAFYCEKFDFTDSSLSIVYDCGTVSRQSSIRNVIEETFKKGESVDALFISHFHEDHVNGIPFLLERCKVKRIFFPAVSPLYKIILKFVNDKILKVQKFTLDLSVDAVATLIKVIKDVNIIRDDKQETLLYMVRETGFDNETMTDIPSLDNIILIRSGVNVLDQLMGKDSLLLKWGWQFVPFNFRQRELIIKLEAEMRSRYGECFRWDMLEDDFRDKAKRQEIKNLFRVKLGDPNVNSMVLYSGPKNPAIQIGGNQNDKRATGCLYTGDYNANMGNSWKQLKGAYGGLWNMVGYIQIPHHGSKHSFNRGMLDAGVEYVISAGENNKYRHPHREVIRWFDAKGNLHRVSELPKSRYDVTLGL